MLEELRGGATLIDGRRTRDYVAGHIPGAISIPAWESPGDKVSALLEKGAVVEAPVVVYCGSSKDCEDSKIVCGVLRNAGFLNLIIYRGGFPEWQQKLPEYVTKGENAGELDLKKLPEETKP
jgi:rhodanese-related sulfurtransferase